MEQAEIAQKLEDSNKKFLTKITKFNAILLSIAALMKTIEQIVPRWTSFDLLVKVDAVLFLILLVGNPTVHLLLEKKAQRGANYYSSVVAGAVFALLAMLIFATH